MSVYVLRDCKHYLDGYDISGDTNKLTAKFMADEHDVTTFGNSGFHAKIAGLTQGQIDSEGFWYADGVDGPDEVFYSRFGSGNASSTDSTVTVCPADGTSGSVAWFGSQTIFEYTFLDGAVGDPATFKTTAKTRTQLVRGLIAVQSTMSLSGTASSSGIFLGVVGSTQSLYGAFHLMSITGSGTPVITMRIEGATNSASFAGSGQWFPFTSQSTSSGEVVRGANSSSRVDTYYRAVWTTSPSTASFTGVVSIGIR
jgi:hypothetical protein